MNSMRKIPLFGNILGAGKQPLAPPSLNHQSPRYSPAFQVLLEGWAQKVHLRDPRWGEQEVELLT